MSKGNRHYKCRLDQPTARVVKATIAHRNMHADAAPWTFSDFLRIACREKVKKMNRSRGRELDLGDEIADLAFLAEQSQPDLFSDDTLDDAGAKA